MELCLSGLCGFWVVLCEFELLQDRILGLPFEVEGFALNLLSLWVVASDTFVVEFGGLIVWVWNCICWIWYLRWRRIWLLVFL